MYYYLCDLTLLQNSLYELLKFNFKYNEITQTSTYISVYYMFICIYIAVASAENKVVIYQSQISLELNQNLMYYRNDMKIVFKPVKNMTARQKNDGTSKSDDTSKKTRACYKKRRHVKKMTACKKM
uniref:Uncharacterized protein n=1 Tax=Glossina brevipalpis TaxID=37001 RepID=A0A1A9W517_9MUSC